LSGGRKSQASKEERGHHRISNSWVNALGIGWGWGSSGSEGIRTSLKASMRVPFFTELMREIEIVSIVKKRKKRIEGKRI